MPTNGQILAVSRHAVTAIASIIAFAATVKLISPADATNLTAAINEISDGFAKIAVFVTPLVGIASAWFSARSASPKAQADSITKNTPGTIVVTDSRIASALPDNKNVVSNNEKTVVTK